MALEHEEAAFRILAGAPESEVRIAPVQEERAFSTFVEHDDAARRIAPDIEVRMEFQLGRAWTNLENSDGPVAAVAAAAGSGIAWALCGALMLIV